MKLLKISVTWITSQAIPVSGNSINRQPDDIFMIIALQQLLHEVTNRIYVESVLYVTSKEPNLNLFSVWAAAASFPTFVRCHCFALFTTKQPGLIYSLLCLERVIFVAKYVVCQYTFVMFDVVRNIRLFIWRLRLTSISVADAQRHRTQFIGRLGRQSPLLAGGDIGREIRDHEVWPVWRQWQGWADDVVDTSCGHDGCSTSIQVCGQQSLLPLTPWDTRPAGMMAVAPLSRYVDHNLSYP